MSKYQSLIDQGLKNAGVVDEGKPPRSTSHAGKASAQVDPLVVPMGRAPAKPERDRRSPLSVRFSDIELAIIQAKAKTVGCNTSEYVRASALGSHYRPPINPELHQILLMLNRELTAHGRNLNQIAKHLNSDLVVPSQAADILDAIRSPLVQALGAVKNALVQHAPQP